MGALRDSIARLSSKGKDDSKLAANNPLSGETVVSNTVLVAHGPGQPLKQETMPVPPIKNDQVSIKVINTGLCHSDLSCWKNEWGVSQYPFVGGHEVVGRVVELGPNVKNLKVGDVVGVGWFSGSCMNCHSCVSGNQNFCSKVESTIIGRTGGFADIVRCSEPWAVPLPKDLDIASAGPLFCGGTTVFTPIVEFGVKPTDTVGVVGIGGLGHLAVQFLNKWGCHVAAFTSNPEKADLAKKLGAHEIISSTDPAAMVKDHAGRFDFILVTANVPFDYNAFATILAPKGRVNVVGISTTPMELGIFPLLTGQKSISASPLGPPAVVKTMLEFCSRHRITAMTEEFPMSKINQAMEHLETGKPKFRIVLTNDL